MRGEEEEYEEVVAVLGEIIRSVCTSHANVPRFSPLSANPGSRIIISRSEETPELQYM